MMENLIVIKTLKDLGLHLLNNVGFELAKYIAIDTETTGLDRDSEVIGISMCWDIETAYYVVLAQWDVTTQKLIYLETREAVQELLSRLNGKSLIAHNATFDCSLIESNFGVDLMPYIHTDTMLLAHLIDENRMVGLKELGAAIFGEDAKKEQTEMKASVLANGGVLTREKYELYKADSDLLGKYGAKDTLLTLKVFYHLVPELYEQGLDSFFYEEETMPLLRGPTYQLNTAGLRIDIEELQKLKGTLETEIFAARAFIYREIDKYVKDDYPDNTFNIASSKQLAWLLFEKLGNRFYTLTKGGRDLCKELERRMPYSDADKREFIADISRLKGSVYAEAKFNFKTKKMGRPKKVGDWWNYLACGKDTLKRLSGKYRWVEKLLEYAKNVKLLNTYVVGIQSRMKYGVIRPSFLQHGTTSGRYSSRNPNFQNLPRKDKRVKSCIIARPGNVFVGADYSQLEPRIFAYYSGDERLMKCFEDGDDFYSVIGMEIFDKKGYSLNKDDENSFAKKFPDLRDIAKAVALSATYGTTAFKMAPLIDKSVEEAESVITSYFLRFPQVMDFMLACHNKAKTDGVANNLFGRPRRLPAAKDIEAGCRHKDLPYVERTLLNLAVNHTIQSTAASIMNRAMIAFDKSIKDPRVTIVMTIHDELIVECPEALALQVADLMKKCMENTCKLEGVVLVADPKVGKNLAELK